MEICVCKSVLAGVLVQMHANWRIYKPFKILRIEEEGDELVLHFVNNFANNLVLNKYFSLVRAKQFVFYDVHYNIIRCERG